MPEPYDPVVIRSPAGACVLSIDPHTRYGVGAADYELRCEESERWRRELAFTLHDPLVTDDGTVVGFSHDERDGATLLSMRVIGADGGIRFSRSHPRDFVALHTVRPEGVGIHLETDPAAAVFRILHGAGWGVDQAAAEVEWLRVSLSDGAELPSTPVQERELPADEVASAPDRPAPPWGSEGEQRAWVRVQRVERSPLRLVATIRVPLGSLAAGVPSRVVSFDFDDRGRIGAIVEVEGQWRFALFEPDGRPVQRHGMGDPAKELSEITHLRYGGGDRWIGFIGREGETRLVELGPGGGVRKLADLDADPWSPVEIWPDREQLLATVSRELVLLDLKGGPIREAEASDDSYGTTSHSLARTGRGFASLEHFPDPQVVWRDATAALDEVVRLDERADLRYPTDLAVSGEGDLFVRDSGVGGAHPTHRFAPDGRWRGAVEQARSDGRPLGYVSDMRVGPDGRLWLLDGELMAFDDDGREVTRIGRAEDGGIGKASAVATHPSGRLLVLDAERRRVVVLGPEADPEASFAIPPAEVPDVRPVGVGLFVDATGAVAIAGREGEWVRFALDGSPRGSIQLDGPHGRPVWSATADPRRDRLWTSDGDALTLRGLDGSVLRRVERGADRRWLGSVPQLVVDETGRLLYMGFRRIEGIGLVSRMHVFGADAQPLASLEVDDRWSHCTMATGVPAMARGRVYLACSGVGIRGVDLDGHETTRFQLPPRADGEDASITAIHADGVLGRLYVLDRDRVLVYALPE